MTETYRQWLTEEDVMHAHCPHEHENPQPFIHPNGKLVCAVCWFQFDETVTEMIPCTPDICNE